MKRYELAKYLTRAPVDCNDHNSPEAGVAAEIAEHSRHFAEVGVLVEEVFPVPDANLDHEAQHHHSQVCNCQIHCKDVG